MNFLAILKGIAEGAEKGVATVAKLGVALGPEITAINPIVGTLASSLGAAVLSTEALIVTPKSGPQKKETVMSDIMLGMRLAFEIEGKQVPPEIEADLSTAIDGLVQAVNKLHSIGATVAAAK